MSIRRFLGAAALACLAALPLACGDAAPPTDGGTDGGTGGGSTPPPDSGGTGGGAGGVADTMVRLQAVATGLDFPLALTAPAGDPRLFIAEKGGRIRIVKNGALLPAPFLDLTGQVSTGGEQGLLGLAFDPGYATNGRFYVDYTDAHGDTKIVAYQVSATPDVADPASARLLLTVPQPFANHNGGHLAFGPDGDLYVALGDGGSEGDPDHRGQSTGDLLGSLLRIDLRVAGTPDRPYGIPADNPFAAQSGARPELWDIGVRNPWRFSFDRATGDLYIGDVGQDTYEEIDVSPAASGGGRGLDYGWSRMEGMHCYPIGTTGCDQAGLTLPVHEYSHADGCSVTGGYVYRGAAIPALQGRYFFADFCQGWVHSFRYANGAATEVTDWPTLAPGGSVPSFGEDASGELYVLDARGGVYKIVAGP